MANPPNDLFQQDKSLDTLEESLVQHRGNLTALQTILAPSWINSPEIRGTTTILWSCIITLVACIYTALHLNVPGSTRALPLLREKMKWVLIGLIAPEIVFYLAFSQFADAKHLSQKLTAMWREKHGAEATDTQSYETTGLKDAVVRRQMRENLWTLTTDRTAPFSTSSTASLLSWAD